MRQTNPEGGRYTPEEAIMAQEFATKKEKKGFSEQAEEESYAEAERVIQALRDKKFDWLGIDWNKIDFKKIDPEVEDRVRAALDIVQESAKKRGGMTVSPAVRRLMPFALVASLLVAACEPSNGWDDEEEDRRHEEFKRSEERFREYGRHQSTVRFNAELVRRRAIRAEENKTVARERWHQEIAQQVYRYSEIDHEIMTVDLAGDTTIEYDAPNQFRARVGEWRRDHPDVRRIVVGKPKAKNERDRNGLWEVSVTVHTASGRKIKRTEEYFRGGTYPVTVLYPGGIGDDPVLDDWVRREQERSLNRAVINGLDTIAQQLESRQ